MAKGVHKNNATPVESGVNDQMDIEIGITVVWQPSWRK